MSLSVRHGTFLRFPSKSVWCYGCRYRMPPPTPFYIATGMPRSLLAIIWCNIVCLCAYWGEGGEGRLPAKRKKKCVFVPTKVTFLRKSFTCGPLRCPVPPLKPITSQSGDALQGGIVKLVHQVFQFMPLTAILADKSDGPSLSPKVERALAPFTRHGGFQPNLLSYAELFENPIQDPV